MPILKEVTLATGHTANYHRIVSLNWQEDLLSAELVANPEYNTENPEPEMIANPAYVDAETTPEEPEMIENPNYVQPEIWSPSHDAATTIHVAVFKDRDSYYQGSRPILKEKIYVKGEDNPFRHANLGKTYAELYADAYAYLITLPEFENGEVIA